MIRPTKIFPKIENTHAHTRTRTHGYLGCLVNVGPLVEQQLDDLDVAAPGGYNEGKVSTLIEPFK